MNENGDTGDHRVEMTLDGLKEDFEWHLRYTLGKGSIRATRRDEYTAFASAVRDRVVERWITTQERYHRENARRVYYLSLEFLMGRLLGNNVINLKADKICREALGRHGIDWNSLRDFETDAGLGNGGLGRLAACYLDSMSTLDLAGMGYGIRYDYGIFRQKIVDGQQVELADNWLDIGDAWLITKTDEPNRFKVQTGYRWNNDAEEEEQSTAEEPEIEITLPEDVLDPTQDAPGAEAAAETIREAVAEAADLVKEKAEAAAEADAGAITESKAEIEA